MRLIRLSVLLLLLVTQFGYAKEITGLNTAEIAVASRAKNDFNSALTKAYQQVLIKLSGNPAILSVPKIQNSLTNKNAYLVSYSYRQRTNPDTNESQLYLWTVFDKKAVKELLEEAGQTLWGANRPLTLVILVDRSGLSWQVGTENDAKVRTIIENFAQDYGLNVMFPALDLEDQATLTDLNGLGLTPQQLQVLSDRYRAEAVLYVGIDADTEATTIDWRLKLADQTLQWPSNAQNQNEAIISGMNHLLETYADHYATLGSDRLQSSILLRVSGIENLGDYTQLLSTLSHLPVVKGITVKDMVDNVVIFEVAVLGGQTSLEHALRGNDFAPETPENDAGVAMAYYHWSRSS